MGDEVSGVYDDDGTKTDPETIPKPSLCVTCKKDDEVGKEQMLCLLNRNDQRDEAEFKCEAYEPKF
jgi:hypothetical protein